MWNDVKPGDVVWRRVFAPDGRTTVEPHGVVSVSGVMITVDRRDGSPWRLDLHIGMEGWSWWRTRRAAARAVAAQLRSEAARLREHADRAEADRTALLALLLDEVPRD